MAVPAFSRAAVTFTVLLASLMNTLDMTIANVALPHIQGSVSASQEQIAWVLTSYIVASAVMTPLTGWLGGRFGRKNLLLASVGAFVVASMLCGAAENLGQIVTARLLQGLAGASLTPLSQSLLFDVTPPERHGRAMALWGAVSLLGPILGPTIGGWLTDEFSWRWVFFINLPLGAIAFLGGWVFLERNPNDQPKPFDFLGFAALAGFLGSLQLLLDRGPTLDWFASAEMWIYLVTAAIALWVFVVHTATVEHPFFDRRLLGDRNFITASLFSSISSVLMFGTVALLPTMLQGLMQYPVMLSGVATVPRGLGSMAAMIFIGRLMDRAPPRLIMAAGLALTSYSLWAMSRFDLTMDAGPVLVSGFIQGVGVGITFVPLTTMAFATVPAGLRAEASTIFTMCRSIGTAVGISSLQALLVFHTQAAHESIAGRVVPAAPAVAAGLPAGFDITSVTGLSALNDFVTRQGMMVAYVDDFYLLFWIALCCFPMLVLLRPAQRKGDAVHVAVD